ncbi:MAG: hypothetical protein ACOX68_01815 [Candidatus Limivicinus sp.]|jgi:type IV secretory pathway component VirB8
MEAREKLYAREAKARAEKFLREKKGYRSREEKKALKIARGLKLGYWKESLEKLDEAEKLAQIKARRIYKNRVNRTAYITAALCCLAAAAAAVLCIVLI